MVIPIAEKTRPSASTSPVLTRLAEPEHPSQWAMRQTGLSNAERLALQVLVSAYTGFQRRNDNFFIAESVVGRYLSIAYTTFQNYVTKLNNVGLLELVYRSPNQHSKSLWRMNFDLIFSVGQLPLVTSESVDSTPSAAADQENVERPTDAEEAVVEPRVAKLHEETRAKPFAFRTRDLSALTDKEIDALIAEYEDHPTWERLTSMTSDEIETSASEVMGMLDMLGLASGLAHRNEGIQSASKQVRVKPRDNSPKRERRSQIESELARSITGNLDGLNLPGLTPAEVTRVVEIEARWRAKNGGEDVPLEYVTYAADEAIRSADRDYAAYLLKVLEDSLERGFTSRPVPKRPASDLGSRYGVKKTRY